jgi:HEAT repeat protein
MKFLVTILLLTSMLMSASLAAGNPKDIIKIKQNTISSLINGLNSENLGLKSSCAYMLGELRISTAVIPLMKILREDKNEDLRIAAALALYKIGTPMSVHAVKQSVRFDESERVSKHCASFYSEYLKNKFNDEEKNDYLVKTARK